MSLCGQIPPKNLGEGLGGEAPKIKHRHAVAIQSFCIMHYEL
jgi:hypothetical protein